MSADDRAALIFLAGIAACLFTAAWMVWIAAR